MTVLLEVCIDSFQSARAAQLGGADRLEVCSSLASEGTTPSCGLIQQCVADLSIPIMMMIRPHDGGFVYTQEDLDVMLTDIHVARAAGVQGVVFGVLDENQHIDRSACARLCQVADGLQTTFHRAFDVVNDPLATLEELIELGFDRVLTSGQQQTAEQGIPLLRELQERAGNRIAIMAGAGVTANNAKRILEQTGLGELHASASGRTARQVFKKPVSFGEHSRVTRSEIVASIKQAIEG